VTQQEIAALPKILRLAGYLSRMAAADEVGARLRLAHAKESTDHDEKWTAEEEAEWERVTDEIDPWWYALTEEEKVLLNPVSVFTACLCRGEDPEEHIKLTWEPVPTGKYGKKHENHDLPQ